MQRITGQGTGDGGRRQCSGLLGGDVTRYHPGIGIVGVVAGGQHKIGDCCTGGRHAAGGAHGETADGARPGQVHQIVGSGLAKCPDDRTAGVRGSRRQSVGSQGGAAGQHGTAHRLGVSSLGVHQRAGRGTPRAGPTDPQGDARHPPSAPAAPMTAMSSSAETP